MHSPLCFKGECLSFASLFLVVSSLLAQPWGRGRSNCILLSISKQFCHINCWRGKEKNKDIFCEQSLPGDVTSDFTDPHSKKSHAEERKGAWMGSRRQRSVVPISACELRTAPPTGRVAQYGVDCL